MNQQIMDMAQAEFNRAVMNNLGIYIIAEAWGIEPYQVVRHGDWKLQVNDRPTDGLQQWLYNLAKDPTEQNNLAASRRDKLNELNALLAAHQANSRGPLYESISQMPVMVDKTLAERFVEGDEYVYTPN